MELFQAQDNFIILNGPNSLWCNRQDGRMQPRYGELMANNRSLSCACCGVFFLMKKFYPSSVIGVDLGEAWSLKCRGIVYGIIGKIQFFPGRQSVISDALI